MKRIGILTSGGDAPGMNACIRAVVRTALRFELEPYGIRRGFAGMIEGDIHPMDHGSVGNIIARGGTILHSARSKEFRERTGREQAYKQISEYGIEALITMGGDGTFRGAAKFNEEVDLPVIGIPCTIDNDLYGTDFAIGYDTAINTAMRAIDKIKDTAASHGRLFFVEVMGRDAGFIALRSAIATGSESVLVPESKTSLPDLIDLLKERHKTKKTSSIVVVAEGDDAGGAFQIANAVKPHFQEFDIRVTVLGHIQRGGSPTCMERVRASRMGMEAIKGLIKGRNKVMVGTIGGKISYTPFEQATKHHMELSPLLLELVETLA